MPWDVTESDRCPADHPWAVIAQDGELMGCHASRQMALRQQAALYANEPGMSGRTGMSEKKSLTGVKVTDTSEGRVEAVFATLNVIDHDGDVTVPGAFKDGAEVVISAYGHKSWEGHPPIGRGVIRVAGDDVILDGQFFMDDDAKTARETFATIKRTLDLQEWSYGFDVVKSSEGEFDGKDVRFLEELDVHEVSPVMKGAGVNTRTLAVKDKQGPFSEQAEQLLGDAAELLARAKTFGSQSSDAERKEGRALSTANRERILNAYTALGELYAEFGDLLAATDPDKHRNAAAQQLALALRAGF